MRFVERSTKKEYAVKTFSKKSLAKKEGHIELVKNEIQLSRKLDHRNIAEVYEVYETQQNVMIVMEYCNAGDLFDLKSSILAAEVDFNEIFHQILQALFYLKRQKIVHRDLKLENLMLKREEDKTYSVKLIDFGLASYCELSDVKQDAVRVCGTPGYIAPEILTGRFSDHDLLEHCDIYSAGTIFFYLCSGEMPFEEGNFEQVLKRNKKGVINYSALECSGTERALKDLVFRMLEKKREKRISVEDALKHHCFPYNTAEIKKRVEFAEKSETTCHHSTFLTENRQDFGVHLGGIGCDLTQIREGEDSDKAIHSDSRKLGVINMVMVMKNKFTEEDVDETFIPLDSVGGDSSEDSELSSKIRGLNSPKPRLIKDFASSL